MRVGIAAVAAIDQIAKVALDNHAGGFVGGELFQLAVKPLAPPDDGGDEIRQGFTLHRHPFLKANQRVITGGQRLANRRNLVAIEAVGLLFAGVDDNGDPVHHQNGIISSIAAPGAPASSAMTMRRLK